jgi:predicted nucleotidyltransferase
MQAMTVTDRIEINSTDLLEVCHRFQVAGLSLFGSALREDFRPESDIDLLVEFKPEARVGLLALSRLRRELERIFGRPVDLVPRGGVKDDLRKVIEDHAKVLYAA